MPNLVIVIPFNADATCDLDISATEMQTFFNGIANHYLGNNLGSQINNINIVYQDTQYNCAAADYVIVFAHGGKEDSELSNNRGQVITMDNAINKLTDIDAQNTERLLCMCCFSGLPDHIGAVWKDQHAAQETFGGDSAISNLYSSTRTQIKTVCLALFQL
jgi:hypothetical protein